MYVIQVSVAVCLYVRMFFKYLIKKHNQMHENVINISNELLHSFPPPPTKV